MEFRICFQDRVWDVGWVPGLELTLKVRVRVYHVGLSSGLGFWVWGLGLKVFVDEDLGFSAHRVNPKP